MHVINHDWSSTKQRLHPQSVAEINRHSVLSGDRIWQCGTSSGSRTRTQISVGKSPFPSAGTTLAGTHRSEPDLWLESPGRRHQRPEWFFLALWLGSIRIRSAGGIFGFPRLVYSPRYSRGADRDAESSQITVTFPHCTLKLYTIHKCVAKMLHMDRMMQLVGWSALEQN